MRTFSKPWARKISMVSSALFTTSGACAGSAPILGIRASASRSRCVSGNAARADSITAATVVASQNLVIPHSYPKHGSDPLEASKREFPRAQNVFVWTYRRSMAAETDVEFFWDPMCPWAWLTSRWVVEVSKQTGLSVNWRFICLRLLNEKKNYSTDFPDRYVAGHGSGQKLLRVAAAIRDREGIEPMGALYTQFGGDIHVRRRRKELTDHWEAGFPDYLRSVGVAEQYIGEANQYVAALASCLVCLPPLALLWLNQRFVFRE